MAFCVFLEKNAKSKVIFTEAISVLVTTALSHIYEAQAKIKMSSLGREAKLEQFRTFRLGLATLLAAFLGQPGAIFAVWFFVERPLLKSTDRFVNCCYRVDPEQYRQFQQRVAPVIAEHEKTHKPIPKNPGFVMAGKNPLSGPDTGIAPTEFVDPCDRCEYLMTVIGFLVNGASGPMFRLPEGVSNLTISCTKKQFEFWCTAFEYALDAFEESVAGAPAVGVPMRAVIELAQVNAAVQREKVDPTARLNSRDQTAIGRRIAALGAASAGDNDLTAAFLTIAKLAIQEATSAGPSAPNMFPTVYATPSGQLVGSEDMAAYGTSTGSSVSGPMFPYGAARPMTAYMSPVAPQGNASGLMYPYGASGPMTAYMAPVAPQSNVTGSMLSPDAQRRPVYMAPPPAVPQAAQWGTSATSAGPFVNLGDPVHYARIRCRIKAEDGTPCTGANGCLYSHPSRPP